METVSLWLEQWMTPLYLIFLIIPAGYAIGKIRVKGICLDLSAILIVSILVGVFFDLFPQIQVGNGIIFRADGSITDTMKFLSSFGTALFISVIGISSGYELAAPKKKKAFRYFLVGALTVTVNLLLMKFIFFAEKKIDEALLYGVFCGAMTTTPGLAAVCESLPEGATQASAGYGCAYLFGVIGVVLFVQFVARGKLEPEKTETKVESVSASGAPALFGLIQIAFSIVLGSIVGAFEIPRTSMSLGSSGGILISGILLGILVRKSKPSVEIPQSYRSVFRNLGLILFFIGAGIPAGMRLLETFEPYVFVYGIILTLFPIAFSYFLCHYGLRIDKRTSLSVVCGGMTSTPAFGVLSRCGRLSADASVYSITYTGALSATVIFLNLLTT